jgi:hypothetical protein
MHLKTISDSNNSSCQNCGRGSHCGAPLYATAQHYEVDGGEYYEIKICDSCRCKQCTKTVTPKTYIIPKKEKKIAPTWKEVLKHMRELSHKR